MTEAPSAQTAVDAVGGWSTALPRHLGVVAGPHPVHDDARIHWVMQQCGGVEGRRVVELGPLDGGHTAMLHAGGAARIDAIEANRNAFLRCLITKELLRLDRGFFHLGDFTLWLEDAAPADLIVASGVLYHTADPVGLIDLLARRTDRLFLWTHVVDPAAMPEDDPRWHAFTGEVETRSSHGVPVTLRWRSYGQGADASDFCGGPHDRHAWIERGALLALLRAHGFDRLETAHETPDGPHGPALSIYAERSRR